VLFLSVLTSVTFTAGPVQASFPGLNGRITCSGALNLPVPGGQSALEIFTINPDATGELRLTTNFNSDFSPRWSADGKKIAFVRDNEIFTMNADGTNQQGPLTNTVNNTFVGDWSPDGSKIIFQTSRDGNFEVYRMNADGSNPVNLTNNAVPGINNDSQPAYSPDGTKITFHSNRAGNSNIHVMNADGSNVVNLTATSPAEESAPRWSPDGSQIAFQSDRATFPRPGIARNLEIFRMSAVDGAGVRRLTFNDFDNTGGPTTSNLTGFDLNPSWSPEGDRIVFHSGRAAEFRETGSPGIVGQWEAYHVDAVNGEGPGGGAPTRVTNRPGNDERCDWQALEPGPPTQPVGIPTPVQGPPTVVFGPSTVRGTPPTSSPGPPLIELGGPDPQRLPTIVVTARTDEDAALEASGIIAAPRTARAAQRRAKRYRLPTVRADARNRIRVTLRLQVPRRAATAIKRRLTRGRRATARITVLATDQDGEKRTVHRTVRIKR